MRCRRPSNTPRANRALPKSARGGGGDRSGKSQNYLARNRNAHRARRAHDRKNPAHLLHHPQRHRQNWRRYGAPRRNPLRGICGKHSRRPRHSVPNIRRAAQSSEDGHPPTSHPQIGEPGVTHPPFPNSFPELAEWLSVDERLLTDLLSRAGSLYQTRRRKKPNGRFRTLHIPSDDLRHVQRAINRRLLIRLSVSRAAHGFVRGRSIAEAARCHVGRACVVRIDLKDFFPSIRKSQVVEALVAVGIAPEVAEIIAQLTTRRGRLPQGAPTSPALSNLVFRACDGEISGLSRRMKIQYTRYADDLIFSGGADTPRIIEPVREIVERTGFRIHPGKTRIQRRGVAQRVLGLTVNDRLGVPRRERRLLRAVSHRLASSPMPPDSHRLMQLRGHVAHIASVAPDQAAPLERAIERIAEGVRMERSCGDFDRSPTIQAPPAVH